MPNPFGLEPPEQTYRFPAGWPAYLLGIGGFEASGDDTAEIRRCVEDLFRGPRRDRRMGRLVKSLPVRMCPALDRCTAPEPGNWQCLGGHMRWLGRAAIALLIWWGRESPPQ